MSSSILYFSLKVIPGCKQADRRIVGDRGAMDGFCVSKVSFFFNLGFVMSSVF